MIGQIKVKKDGTILASAPVNEIVHIEGNHYFAALAIQSTQLETSDRLYNCPKKGICNWIDLKTKAGYLNNIAWIYPETTPAYNKIAGRYGFYGKNKYYDYTETE